jgi:putative ABC transport system ATP-binding protein
VAGVSVTASAPKVLELRDVVKHYRVGSGAPVRAIDRLSLTVAAGEFVALYGPSGSGKTTLLELVAGTIRPDRGTVSVDGQDISTFSEHELDDYRLTQLGIVGPPEWLIPGAFAIENASLRLALTDTRKANASIEPLMERLGLGDRMRHRTEELSMGERQRVMIAMALATTPRLVLADEPTGNLDTERTREVLGLLREICSERGTTVLLATHDPQAVAFADRSRELRDGRLSDYRSDRQLLADVSSGTQA